ncbi:MAG: hypothetical protein ACR2OI_12610 [Acidimicrobiia bacterium]
MAALVAGLALLAARARRTSAATRQIRASLQDNLFSDVGHRDLTVVAETLRSLQPLEASGAVAGLSEHELGVWMRELDGWAGGFSSAEQDRLFSDLAARLSPEQLARLAAEGKTGEIIEAASVSTPPQERVELALLLWATRSPENDGWGQIGSLLGAVPPAALGRALEQAPPDWLGSHLFGHHRSRRDERPRVRLDAVPQFLAAAATLEDAALRADVFVAVAGELAATADSRVTGPVGRGEVLGGLASLLRRDPAATISELNHRSDPHANTLSRWIQQMIEADRLDELDVILADLLGGVDRLGHFTNRGLDAADPYPHASNLGYFVGAYGLAIDAIADDAGERINLVAQLFAIVTGVVPGDGGGGVRLPAGPLVDRHAAAVVAGLRDEATSLKQTLWGLAKPRDADGSLWNGEGTTQFQDAWEEVMLVR